MGISPDDERLGRQHQLGAVASVVLGFRGKFCMKNLHDFYDSIAV